jgi:hypothetical protein
VVKRFSSQETFITGQPWSGSCEILIYVNMSGKQIEIILQAISQFQEKLCGIVYKSWWRYEF